MPASRKHLKNIAELGQALSGILARWRDNKFYKVVEIIETDKDKCRCLFEDDAVHMIHARDLHLELDPERVPDNMLLCCVCDQDTSEPPDELVFCDSCNQGYHIECHSPRIDRAKIDLEDPDASWECATCREIIALKLAEDKQQAENLRPPQTPKQSARKSTASKSARTKKDTKPHKVKLGSSNKFNKVSKTDDAPRNIPSDELVPLKADVADKDNNNSLFETPKKRRRVTKKHSPSEEMDNEVIAIAKKVLDSETRVNTKDFVGLITPSPESPKPY